MINLKNSQYL